MIQPLTPVRAAPSHHYCRTNNTNTNNLYQLIIHPTPRKHLTLISTNLIYPLMTILSSPVAPICFICKLHRPLNLHITPIPHLLYMFNQAPITSINIFVRQTLCPVPLPSTLTTKKITLYIKLTHQIPPCARHHLPEDILLKTRTCLIRIAHFRPIFLQPETHPRITITLSP